MCAILYIWIWQLHIKVRDQPAELPIKFALTLAPKEVF